LNLVARQHVRVAHAAGKADAGVIKSIVQQVDDVVRGRPGTFKLLLTRSK
jgi:hypothetical protein